MTNPVYSTPEILVLRNRIVEEARTWLGVPWVHQGRSRAGIDCAGKVIKVAHALNLSMYDTDTYPRRPESRQFIRHFRRAGGRQKNPKFRLPGDIGLLKFDVFPCHCGIFSYKQDNWYFIHAYAPRHKVVEDLFDETFESRLSHVLAYPGVGD